MVKIIKAFTRVIIWPILLIIASIEILSFLLGVKFDRQAMQAYKRIVFKQHKLAKKYVEDFHIRHSLLSFLPHVGVEAVLSV